jgi:hypothetical protein
MQPASTTRSAVPPASDMKIIANLDRALSLAVMISWPWAPVASSPRTWRRTTIADGSTSTGPMMPRFVPIKAIP